MVTQIPVPEGQKIEYYEEHKVLLPDAKSVTMYRPVYKPILEIGKCVIDINDEVFLVLPNNVICDVNGNCIHLDNTIDLFLASGTETKQFFDSLKQNGYEYNPETQKIELLFYFFPEYTLYEGFRPCKKMWIGSDADKFYKKHGETFITFEDCAYFCNCINRSLHRDYPTIGLEE